MENRIVSVPGQRIGRLDDSCSNGPGTYLRNGFIYSSLAGFVNTIRDVDGKNVIEVRTEVEQSVLPFVGSIVTARVTNVNPRFCKCHILSVENSSLRETFRGVVRRDDVRATEKDKVEMYKTFRPGDIILARVLSLGDAQAYLLTTAENELGVVIATSEAGARMVPISWNEMQCPNTMIKENRKVAKVRSDHIQDSEQG